MANNASDTLETGLLAQLFNNMAFTGVGDTNGLPSSTAAGALYISLHTASPGEAGAQNTSEANYTGYARVAVARTAAGWTVSGNGVTNVADILFGECTAGSSTITHFGIGTAATGAGKLMIYVPLTASLPVTVGIAPKFAAGAISVTVD